MQPISLRPSSFFHFRRSLGRIKNWGHIEKGPFTPALGRAAIVARGGYCPYQETFAQSLSKFVRAISRRDLPDRDST
jgi:hypothetical protein